MTVPPDSSGQNFTATPKTYRVTGRVTDGRGAGLSGITVSGGGRTTTSASDGSFTLDGLTQGTYQIRPEHSGYTFDPLTRSVSVPPDATGQNFARTYQLSGTVREVNGGRMAGIKITVIGLGQATTASDGSFVFNNVHAGSYRVSASKTGYTFSPFERLVDLPPDAKSVNFDGIGTGEPIVLDVRQCVSGRYFLAGASLPNRFDAIVDWRGKAPGVVKFILNGTTISEIASSNTVSHVYDMGEVLRYSLLGTSNELQIIATNLDHQSSAAYLMNVFGIQAGLWLPGYPVVLNPGCWQGAGTYSYGLTAPEPAFEAKITPPSWVPYLGDKPFGIKRTQGAFSLKVATDGTGYAEVSGQTGFDVAGQSAAGRLYGQASPVLGEGQGVKLLDRALGTRDQRGVKQETGRSLI